MRRNSVAHAEQAAAHAGSVAADVPDPDGATDPVGALPLALESDERAALMALDATSSMTALELPALEAGVADSCSDASETVAAEAFVFLPLQISAPLRQRLPCE